MQQRPLTYLAALFLLAVRKKIGGGTSEERAETRQMQKSVRPLRASQTAVAPEILNKTAAKEQEEQDGSETNWETTTQVIARHSIVTMPSLRRLTSFRKSRQTHGGAI